MTSVSGVRVVFTVCAASLLSGCSGELEKAMQASRELGRVEALSPPEPPAGAMGTALYVDPTESVRGFAACGREGQQPSPYTLVLQRTARLISATEVVYFGQRTRPDTISFQRVPATGELGCPGPLNWQNNPDFALHSAIRADTLHDLSIYLTDGVLSDVDGVLPTRSARELRDWLAEGNQFAVVAFRGSFRGRFWSEERQRMLPSPMEVPDRPFYLFVFSRTGPRLDEFLDGVAAFAGDLDLVGIARFGGGVRCDVQTTGTLLRRLDANQWLAVRLGRDGIEVPLTFNCRTPRHWVLAEISLTPTLEYWRWVTRRFNEADRPRDGVRIDDLRIAVDGRGASGTGRSVLELQDDVGARFGHYNVSFAAGAGSVPAWLTELYGESDGSLGELNRTYRLGWVFEGLVSDELARQGVVSRFRFMAQYP